MGFFGKSESGDKDKWKEKYLTLIDQQEKSENVYKENQGLLCKTIIRLSVATIGFDPHLDPHLRRIRDHLKKGLDSNKLKIELETFTDALARIGDATPNKQAADADSSMLFAFLLQHYTSAKHQQALTRLKESYQKKNLDNPQSLFSEIAEIIECGPAESRPLEPSTPVQAQIDPGNVSKLLLHLLENIEIPAGLVDIAQTLKRQLAASPLTIPLEQLFENVVTLLLKIRANEEKSQDKAYQENQELLCKTIVRLSVAAAGLKPGLDPHLQCIREHLKNGLDNHQLKTELESFIVALSQIKDESFENKSAADPFSLFAFLFQRYTSTEHIQALNLLKEKYEQHEFTEPQALFNAIAEAIRPDSTDSTDKTPAAPLTHGIDQHFVSKQLLYLLENLEIPDAFSERAQSLKQQLSANQPSPAIESLLDDIISLLLEITVNAQPKQQEINKFLAHITEQLTELGLAVTGSSQAVIDASLNRSKLDQSVTEQMSDLHKKSINATQLEPLKDVISSRIAQITYEIQEHKQKEAIQRETSERQLEELSQKIKVMESETGELKSKLKTASTHATRDTLTELPNRLAYDERLETEVTRWQRYHTPLCLIIWDIDHFKKINDQFGHQVGDKVLVHVAKLLLEHSRKADFVSRFGGEEFTMLLPHTDKQSAFKLAHKLRFVIEQASFKSAEHTVPITISCGITQFVKGDNHEMAFERADQALYRAKKQGRNQCCLG